MEKSILLITLLSISCIASGQDSVFLECKFEKYTDFISLTSPKIKNGENIYTKGTWMRSSFKDTHKLKFKHKSTCHFNCVSAERYTIFTTQHLYRNTLKLVDNLTTKRGNPAQEAQCDIVSKDKWDSKISEIGSANKI